MGIRTNLTAFGWYGGKNRAALQRKILDTLEPNRSYIEPFAGSAAILLNRVPAHFEVLNDSDNLIWNFFTVLRNDTQRLIESLQLTPYSRKEYEACQDTDIEDPLERARRWYFSVNASLRNAPGNYFYTETISRKSSVVDTFLNRVDSNLPAIAARLRNVCIENCDAIALIDKYKTIPNCTIYCDPPYPMETRNTERRYNHETSDRLHRKLLAAVTDDKVASQIVISSLANPMYDTALADWRRMEINVVHSSSDSFKKAREVLYANRAPSQLIALDASR